MINCSNKQKVQTIRLQSSGKRHYMMIRVNLSVCGFTKKFLPYSEGSRTTHCTKITHFWLVTVRKRSFRRLCFYICLSVISAHEGGGVHPGGSASRGGGVHSEGGLHQRGVCIQGGFTSRAGVCIQGWGGGGQKLRDTVNERAVHILLECILVQK